MAAPRATAITARDRLLAVQAVDKTAHALQAVHGEVITRKDREIEQVQARVHEATRPSRQRKLEADWGSANRIVSLDAKQLRDSARALCRDYDVARNGLHVLVQNTVGSGIDVMPAPRQAGGEVNRELAQALRDLWDGWWDRPEVTWQHDFGKCQQLLASSWFRDGEAFWQQLVGPVAFLDHGTAVPLSLELLEADLVPLDYDDPAKGVLQGVERNAWGRVTAYHVLKQHPGEATGWRAETKRVPADQVRHLAQIDRIHQVRGLSVFASVMNRVTDIKDHENSERLAGKVAASFCAQIIKGDATAYAAPQSLDATGAALDRVARSFQMYPGMIADNLEPGEKLEILDSNRPNPNLADYLHDQFRRMAGGIGVSGSSLTLNYKGTYSAQRQELVEKFGAYAMLGEQFVAQCVRPIWKAFVQAAVLSGQIRLPRGWTIDQASAAVFIRPQMPWIDPLKEVLAMGERVDRGWMAPQQAVLLSGNDPEDVQRLTRDWAAQGGTTAADPSTDPARAAMRGAVAAHVLENT